MRSFLNKRPRKGFRKRKPLKRTRLRPYSPEKNAWNHKYVKAKKAFPSAVHCACCHHLFHKDVLEPHHPFGRIKERILAFVWLCQPCHRIIHDEGKQARSLGWLQPQFDGREGETRRMWKQECEQNWPDNLKRKEDHDYSNL